MSEDDVTCCKDNADFCKCGNSYFAKNGDYFCKCGNSHFSIRGTADKLKVSCSRCGLCTMEVREVTLVE